ncbi:MAG TPA: dihydrolipoyllysine-residue succinyltransferase, partial [Prolixibacteraceae bacterium]|nr:dihydrolipoyllysine-residue succinyltransferase [Prolixibacteraceae bacterium]
MIIELKIPTPGESITEVELGKWNVSDGDLVEKDQELGEIESDKATLTLSATESGKIKILVQEGERVAVGAIACTIDTSVAVAKTEEKVQVKKEEKIQEKPEVKKEFKEPAPAP